MACRGVCVAFTWPFDTVVVETANSKALTLFENDLRFQAVEKDREREELFEDYLVDLERKVKNTVFGCGSFFIELG